MVPLKRLDQIGQKFFALEAKLTVASGSPGHVEIAREYSRLKPVVEKIAVYRQFLADIEEAEAMREDPELQPLAEEELPNLRSGLEKVEKSLLISLVPPDVDDARSAIIEIRAGTGGDEASLFCGDLFRIYERYAILKDWKLNKLQSSPTMLGGFREVTASIQGKGVFSRLKYESGVHRVQRVPATEASGRIHTSAATVAVLPEAEDVDVLIDDSDLRIDTMRASGAGGQHVNTTDSAVRITHVPTGIVVTSSEKSQHQNRATALKILISRLYDLERERAHAERAASRRAQVGTGDRSERIRTYNFPQGRITDHRINLTLYKLDQVLEGELDDIIDALASHDRASRLAEIGQ